MRVDVPCAAAHLVEAGGIEGPLVERLPDDGVEADLVMLLAVPEPVLGTAVVLGHDARGQARITRGHTSLEHVRRLDQMIVDRDQRRMALLARRIGEPVDLVGLGPRREETLLALDLVEGDGAGH